MIDFIPAHHFDENTLQSRLEMFRYTNLRQPLMQVLFTLELPADSGNKAD